MDNYLYYNHQVGGGSRIKTVFTGAHYQKGHGVGAFLGGLARLIIPCLTGTAKVVGKEALRTGLNVLDDISNNNVDFKQALKTRSVEASKKLKRKASEKLLDLMRGDGYKISAPKRKRQSKKKRSPTRSSGAVRKRKTGKVKRKKITKKKSKGKKKNLRALSDIFGPK